jgi:orotate phosphoribosyltransferase
MDETIITIINKVTTSYSSPIVVTGGHKVTKFFDCARLSPSDLARLAAQATGDLDELHFDAVVGIAYTGILFAAAVAGGRQVNILKTEGTIYGPDLSGKRVIVVDDVVATGASIRKAAENSEVARAQLVAYACIVDRSSGKLDLGGKELFSAWQAPL